MSVVQIIQSLLCLELDDIFIINYVNNPACFWVCAQTVTWCYSFCGFVVGNCSGTIPRVLNFFLKYFEIETFIHISSCGPCILTILYFWWSIKTWNILVICVPWYECQSTVCDIIVLILLALSMLISYLFGILKTQYFCFDLNI